MLVLVVEWGFPHHAHFEKTVVAYLTMGFSTLQGSPQLSKLKSDKDANRITQGHITSYCQSRLSLRSLAPPVSSVKADS